MINRLREINLTIRKYHGTISFMIFIIYTYYDGKNALIKYRSTYNIRNPLEELMAIKDGIHYQ